MLDKENNWLCMILLLLIVFFGPRFPDKIPDPVLKLFLNPYFRTFIVFISIYSIQYNIYLSIIVTLIFLIVLNKIENSFLFELFLDKYSRNNELFIDMNEEVIDEIFNKFPKKVEKCYQNIKQEFPCNNLDKNNKCCTNINYDLFVKDKENKTENVTLMMNEEMEKNSKEGINNIKNWCKNYLDQGSENIDFNCKNKEMLDKCKKIVNNCDISKWKTINELLNPPKEDNLDFSGTCGAIDKNIHNQVCFDLYPRKNKCKHLDKDQCIRNKKDCFYIENNEFMNSKIKKNNAIYRCKIPKKESDLPKNCFPVKLYKDTCGNVGMGCWIKEEDIEPEIKPVFKVKNIPEISYKKEDTSIFTDQPTISYNPGNSLGNITYTSCK